MTENGIGEVAQLLSVSFNGFKMGADLTLESLKMLKRMASILYHAMQAVPYRKKTGKTNMGNMKARMGEGLQYVTMMPEVYKDFQKFAKKSGILYAQLPNFFRDDGKIFLAVSQNVGPLLQEFLSSAEEKQGKKKIKQDNFSESSFSLSDRKQIEQKPVLLIEDKKNNREINMVEYYMESGCFSVSDREFCEHMSACYPDTFKLDKEIKNWQKKNLPMTEEQLRIEEALLKGMDRELLKKQDSFVLNFNKKQVVGMNETQYKIYVSNTYNVCLWVDKDKVSVSGDGNHCRIVIADKEPLSISHLEDDSRIRQVTGMDFRERLRLLKQEDIVYRMQRYQKYQASHLQFSHGDIVKETANSYLFQVPGKKDIYIWRYKTELIPDHDGFTGEFTANCGYPVSNREGAVIGYKSGAELCGKEEIGKENTSKNRFTGKFTEDRGYPVSDRERTAVGHESGMELHGREEVRNKSTEAASNSKNDYETRQKKNTDLVAVSRQNMDRKTELITISKQNIEQETKEAILFRVPNTQARDYIWLQRKKLTEVHGGKSYAYEIDLNGQYDICRRDGIVKGIRQGVDLRWKSFEKKEEQDMPFMKNSRKKKKR